MAVLVLQLRNAYVRQVHWGVSGRVQAWEWSANVSIRRQVMGDESVCGPYIAEHRVRFVVVANCAGMRARGSGIDLTALARTIGKMGGTMKVAFQTMTHIR